MGKRGQNEGTIRKRKDGRWEARAIIGRTIDGKPKFKYIYKKTRAEASAELSKVLAELAEDSFINETNITFVGWLKMIKELKTHMKIQNIEKQIIGSAYIDKNFLFCNEIGEPYDQKTFKNYYNKILAECGLIEARPKTIPDKIKKGLKTKLKPKGSTPNVTFHTLRHTFATRAIEQGMDILVLSKILGHSDPSTTLNKYGHALPNHKKDNMEKNKRIIFCIGDICYEIKKY